MTTVFLSYSHKDHKYMEDLRTQLELEDFTVASDMDLEIGTRVWEMKITKAIDHAHCLIVLLSPHAKQSEWVTIELSYAETVGCRIFPMLIHGEARNAIPLRLASTQFVDARGDFDDAVRRLIAGISRYMASDVPESRHERQPRSTANNVERVFEIRVTDRPGTLTQLLAILHRLDVEAIAIDASREATDDRWAVIRIGCTAHVPTQGAMIDLIEPALADSGIVGRVISWRPS